MIKENEKVLILLLLLLTLSLSSLSLNVIAPSLISIVREFGVDVKFSPLVVTAFFFSYAFGQLFTGHLSDKIGRRGILIIGVFIYSLSSLMCGLSTSFYMLIISRVIQGFSAGIGVTIYRSAVFDIYKGDTGHKLFSYLTAFFSLITILAPIIGGYFEKAMNWHFSFYFLSLFSLVLFIILQFYFKETNNSKVGWNDFSIRLFIRDYYSTSKELFVSKPFIKNTISLTLIYSALLMLIATLPGVVKKSFPIYSDNLSTIYLFMVTGYMIGNITNARLIGKISNRAIHSAGHFIIIISSLIIYFLDSNVRYATLLLILLTLNIGIGAIFPKFMSEIVNLFPNKKGASAAVSGFIQCILSSLLVSIVSIWTNSSLTIFIFIMILTIFSYLILIPKNKI